MAVKRTRVPCPGCGKARGLREADKVCHECQSLMKDGQSARELQAANPERMVVKTTDVPHWLSSAYLFGSAHIPGTSQLTDEFRRLWAEFTMALTEPAVHSVTWDAPYLVTRKSRYNLPDAWGVNGEDIYGGSALQRTVNPEVHRLLNELDSCFRRMLCFAHRIGYQDGSNLLHHLAQGDMGIQAFEDQRVRNLDGERG